MKPVFRDPELEKAFDEKGYVVVPFLSPEEVEQLKQQFFDTIEESGGPRTSEHTDFETKADISYDFTFIDKNVGYKKKVYDIITEKFKARADAYLDEYTPIIANYIRKQEGGGEVPMHQNWAFVDEMSYTSVSIWVPLVDSNEANGTLQMVEGSHKKFGKLRGPMIPWELRGIKEEIVAKHLTPMNVKAGQGVILDDSIVHYSNINKTPGLRLAIQLIMIPKAAASIHYHLDRTKDQNNVTMLETDVDFYMNFHPWLKPVGMKELATLPYREQLFSYDDFLKGMKAERFDRISVKDESLQLSKAAPLFKDPKTQEAFDRDGFVKINLLNTEEVESLKSYYHSLQHAHIGDYGFHVTLDSKDPAYISGVFDKLFTTLVPKLDHVLTDYKPFTASYVIKEAGLQNIVPPHQDWTFVDEDAFCSATVWVPLMDVNKNNGALSVIRGSHRLFNEARRSPSPQSKSLFTDHVFAIFPYVEVIDMKAGEALIFNNKTVHASPPNISGITRIGVGIGVTQKNAGLVHHYQVPGEEQAVNVYKVDEAFFRTYNNSKLSKLYEAGQVPGELELISTYRRNTVPVSREEITERITSVPGNTFNTELMKELAGLYHYTLDGKRKEDAGVSGASENTSQAQHVAATEPAAETWVDPRGFLEKYSVSNIVAEIKYRLSKK